MVQLEEAVGKNQGTVFLGGEDIFCGIVDGVRQQVDVIQGGSPDNDIMTDSDWHIKGEFTENGVNNPLKHIRGALSMARDDDFDTAGTQFFVVHKDAAKLDGRYAAFGEMESGFDVLDAIANQPTYGPETWNKPKQMPVITKITIED